ncbi:MAG: hypothetical protein U0798_02380 [Gemmataceae bacterium]
MKHLLDEFAVDWIAWLAPRLGLPSSTSADPLNVDLSTIQLAADKVFRLNSPVEGLLHIEPQTSWDNRLDERMMLYNGLLHERYGGPVYSVALLLRREANVSTLTGVLSRKYPSGREYLRFEYSIIRVWELPAEPLLSGPWGSLPLALLTDEAKDRLSEFVGRMDERLRSEQTSDSLRRTVLTSGYILLGLRYNEEVIRKAFEGATGMKESTTYQAILREGRQEGRQEGRLEGRNEGLNDGQLQGFRESLLNVLNERFGNCPVEIERRIRESVDLTRLQKAIRQAVRIQSPADLQL